MHQSWRRQLVFGVRGSMTVELTTYGANRPLHSGHYGNWAPNPTDELVRLLASLKDDTGQVRVAGFHDQVRDPTAAELAAIAAMPPVDDGLQAELGLAAREGGEERIERLVLDPAIIIKGLQAGGVGAQSANVIRPTARASLNVRLVPDQTPEVVLERLVRHFEAQGAHVDREPPDAEVLARHRNVLLVENRGGYPGFRTPLDSPQARRLVRLLDEIDGRSTLLTPTMGGSLPIHLFEQALELPIILLPIANHDNNQHGADENLRIANLWDAIDVYAAVIAGYGSQP
jgi:acetylornithine deacetylase/succinyl-diaminopimelate desuccinylase-like protein